MGAIINGFRNVYRNRLRTSVVLLLISLPFFTFMMMSSIGDAMDDQVNRIKGVNTLIQVMPRGSLGHVNMAWYQNRLLPEGVEEEIKGIEHVVKVEGYILVMEPVEDYYMTMHIGVKPGDKKRLESHGEVGDPVIIAGRDFRAADAGRDVAILGRLYAERFGIFPESLTDEVYFTREELKPGPGLIGDGRRSLSGRQLKVVGIFSSGYVFGDNQLFMPLDTSKEIYGINGLSRLYVTVDSVDNVGFVRDRIKSSVGGAVDVITAESGADFVSSAAGSVKEIIRDWVLMSLALMTVIVLFTMALVVRERVKEIGILKAMGASNSDVAMQFVAESFALTLIGGLLGMVLFAALGSSVGQRFFSVAMMSYLPTQYGGTLYENLIVDYSLSLSRVLLLFIVAFIVALAGSAYPIIKSIMMKPAEAIRHD